MKAGLDYFKLLYLFFCLNLEGVRKMKVVGKIYNIYEDHYDVFDKWVYRFTWSIVIFAFGYSLFEIWRFY